MIDKIVDLDNGHLGVDLLLDLDEYTFMQDALSHYADFLRSRLSGTSSRRVKRIARLKLARICGMIYGT